MTDRSNDARPERLFSGQIGAEYEMLKLIVPAAVETSRRVAENVATLEQGPDGTVRAIEIGCGTGITTRALLEARDDLDLTSLDNEPTMLGQARENLAPFIAAGRLRLVEADALSALGALPTESIDLVASAYTTHNFLDSYRILVLAEIFRVLRPGGTFVNGDRFALDDSLAQTRFTQTEAKHYFDVFGGLGRYDMLEQWIIHLFSDESADRLMRLGPALEQMRKIGFAQVDVVFREDVNTLLAARKPAPRREDATRSEHSPDYNGAGRVMRAKKSRAKRQAHPLP
jgi:tRNA (cmo5U34)-methyltransferase